MIVKIGGDATGRLARLCVDLQPFTFSVKHRSGDQHLDADAMSRLLHYDDDIYIKTADDLRNDFEPLTTQAKEWLDELYPTKEGQTHLGEFLSNTIDNFRIENAPNIHNIPKHYTEGLESTKLTEEDLAAIEEIYERDSAQICSIINTHRSEARRGYREDCVQMNMLRLGESPPPTRPSGQAPAILRARKHTQNTRREWDPLNLRINTIQQTTVEPINWNSLPLPETNQQFKLQSCIQEMTARDKRLQLARDNYEQCIVERIQNDHVTKNGVHSSVFARIQTMKKWMS